MDQLSAMRAFVRVAQAGSFSAAARDQSQSQATISKKVAALENKLGVKLITRSSRDQALTPAGIDYYQHCLSVIADIDEADAKLRSKESSPEGLLRISVPVSFGRLVLAQLMSEFLQKYPQIQLEMHLSERDVNLIVEGFDVAICAHTLDDSSLVARPLFESRLVLVATTSYIHKFGKPDKPDELKRHNCIRHTQTKNLDSWNFTFNGIDESVAVSGSLRSNSAETNLEFVLSGEGIARFPVWMVDEHIQSGLLVQILSDYQTDSIPFNAIYLQNRYVPLKVRCFIEFIKEKLS